MTPLAQMGLVALHIGDVGEEAAAIAEIAIDGKGQPGEYLGGNLQTQFEYPFIAEKMVDVSQAGGEEVQGEDVDEHTLVGVLLEGFLLVAKPDEGGGVADLGMTVEIEVIGVYVLEEIGLAELLRSYFHQFVIVGTGHGEVDIVIPRDIAAVTGRPHEGAPFGKQSQTMPPTDLLQFL